MTSFNVGGRVLDLPANFKLQFMKKNPLFAFDELEVERTTKFAVPKTPNNLLALGFANDFHRRGEMMRRKVEAQMQSGIVTRNGYLYVGSFNGSEFECIFVTGELLFLQQLRDLGDISQFINAGLVCTNNAEIVSANQSENTPAGRVDYKTDGDVKPSWLLSEIITQAVTNSGASVDLGNTLQNVAGYRIICGAPKGVAPTPVTLTRTWLAEQVPYNSAETPVTNTMTAQGLDVILDSEVFEYPIFSYDQQTAQQYYGKVEQVVTRQDIVITFPDDTPDTLFLGRAMQGGYFDFLGGYSFRISGSTYLIEGEPLAGRSVEIATGTAFCLITTSDLLNTDELGGWRISQGTLSVSVIIEGKKEQPENAIIRAKDNLPEMTVVELLKVLAVLSGRLLGVDGGLVVFERKITGGRILDNIHVIDWSDLVRTFSDYAQRNTIDFNSDEQLLQADKVAVMYTLDNDNIDVTKTLQTIPMNEGSRQEGGILFIRGDYDGYTLSASGNVYLEHISLPLNNNLQELLNESTSIVIECRLSLFDFDRLRQKDVIYYDGAIWVWTEAQWSNGVAKLGLSITRISEEPVLPDEYQELKWVENVRCVTNIPATAGTDFEIDFQFTDQLAETHLLGAYRGYGEEEYSWWIGLYYDTDWAFANGEEYRHPLSGLYDRHIIRYITSSNAGVDIDGVRVVSFAGNYETPQNIGIGYDGNAYPADGRLFGFSATRGMVRYKLVPCYRISDNKVGLYDIYNGIFYTNSSSGEMIAGDIV